MKKQITQLSILASFLLLFFNAKAVADTLYYQSFDSSITNLPTGWAATAGGWVMDTSNSSLGQYAGASGNSNVVVKNTSATGTYELVTSNISTLGFTSINVSWAARLTKNFLTPGSNVQGFYMSIDNGTTWDSIPYTENATGSSSPWLVDNDGAAIALPDTAGNEAHVQFKWVVNIVTNANGTYRIDDFTVTGTPAVATAVQNIPTETLAKVYTTANAIQITTSDVVNQSINVEVFNILGETIAKQVMNSSSLSINDTYLQGGVYLVKVSKGTSSTVTKVFVGQ